MHKAVIYKSTGSWYVAKDESGKQWQARMKGVFKIDDITSTNPIAVGDEVELEPEGDAPNNAMIVRIGERRNYINRQSPRHKRQHHIVASNLDQSVLIATLKDPRTSSGFIDRFLVATEMYHVPALLVFNKTDLYKKKELELLDEYYAVYTEAGYTVLPLSLKTGLGLEEIKSLLQDKVSLVSGHSGVGKSSFINAVMGSNIRTQDVSGWSGKGMHTTTFAEMYDLPGGGKIIDTPGMREFGLVDVEKQELSGYFPEMRKVLQNCQYNNCLHTNEQDCAVKEAVREGQISEDRYVSYCSILDSLQTEHWK